MDEYLNKYTKPDPKAPKSAHGEQINQAIKITGWEFKKLAGLTRHLNVQQIFELNKESKGKGALWKWLLDNKYMANPDKFKSNPDYILVKESLEKNPTFRERSQRHVGLAILALRTTDAIKENEGKDKKDKKIKFVSLQDIYSKRILTINEIAEQGKRFSNLDRWWRKVLEQPENEHLRGSDYYSAAELETIKRNKLGYK
jgi:hypothetical protein